MFSSKEHLDKKTGSFGIGRFSFLRSLKDEYEECRDLDARKQVLANLANFAYDPINYGYIRRLKIIDLFLGALEDNNEKIVEFSIGGLCNLALDKENKELILAADGVHKVITCMSSTNQETVLSAMTTLTFLITPQSKQEITSPAVVECMMRFSKSTNKRHSNLATVFLQDYCTKQQCVQASELFQESGT
ncbi:armadillo repeat-containing protein 7-like [Lineus longissimus]|uniref:armadillo repeat-containing protein 7-like n=1 Tax=Lineus longissimus TaxID=88925 RepID=UPI002B4CC1AA